MGSKKYNLYRFANVKTYKRTFIGENVIDSDEKTNEMNKAGGVYGREQLLSREQQRRAK